VAPPVDPAVRAKMLRTTALMVVAVSPLFAVLMVWTGIRLNLRIFGIDLVWWVALLSFVLNGGVAWFLFRQAATVDRTAQGLPPRGQ